MPQSDPDFDLDEYPTGSEILILSVVTFVIAAVLGLGGCWLAEINLADLMQVSWSSVGSGLLISLAMFVPLAFVRFAGFQWTRRLWETPVRVLGTGLTDLNAVEVASVAIMAGVGEELLFRGFLQGWLVGYGILWGLLVPNVLFGLLHAMTFSYAVGAFLVGLCFSCLLHFSGEIDLTSLMTAHAMYDFVAWHWLARHVRFETS